ncbi:hypothetical protein Pse7367_1402 [Thalassoporum mexicanum PCC 7367]|uniref:hypothetical protein n=1 Tax=Thalassoporum mexicanum TaxID=3457544 RepID=UPI00029F97BA|nr:hypothetical protein [Pseudanabaena sp. PCC 7367]AFY69693.1 hypothetical protein Pse7367_1402 [Pseudanabaena sp. PCC 7367]
MPAFQQSLAIALVSTIATLNLSNAAIAREIERQNIGDRPAQPELIAQLGHNYCRSSESMFVAAETDNYFINICGGDLPSHYVGVQKSNTRNSIRVPLSDYQMNGDYFEAVNGDVVYILSRTIRGDYLTVTQGGREILREVAYW